MSKNKSSIWAQEVQYDELFKKHNSYDSENLLNVAYDALTKFNQKELRRGKVQKKGRHCWQ